MQFFVNGAVFASFVPRLPEIRDRVDVTLDQVGLLLSVAGLAGLVGSLVVGRVVDRLGTRRVLLTGGSLLALTLPLIGLARSPVVLLVALALMMFFDVMVDVAMNLQGSWLSARRHAPVMNRLHGLWSLGTVIGGLVSSRSAAAGVPLSIHLAVATAVLGLGLVYVGRGLLRTDEHHETPDPGTAPSAGSVGSAMLTGRLALAALTAAGFFALTVEATSSDWAAFRFADDLGFSAGAAALGYVATTGGMTVGRLAGDWMSVRLGPARLGRLANGVAGTGLAMATLVDLAAVTLLGFLLAGLGTASMLPAIYDRAARQPGRAGAGLGALTAGLRVAALTIPVVVGLLAATSLSVGAAMAVVTLPAVAGFAAIGRLLSPR